MKIEFKISFEDYYEYNKTYATLSLGKKLRNIFSIGVAEAVIGLGVLIFCFTGVLDEPITYMLGSLLAVVGIYMLLYAKVFFYTRLKREVRHKHKNSDYFKNIRTVEFLEDSVVTYSQSDDYRAEYREDLKEFIETKNLFIVMIHGRRGIIIPKRETDIAEMHRLLRKIGEEYDIRYRYIKG